MNESAITELFSYICGQSRSFVADGAVLPVDQRCLGLYVGALLTALWLALSGVWRYGLPHRTIVVLHTILVVFVVLGGKHVIDPGPLWRFGLGLLTGHMAVFWMITGAAELSGYSRLGKVPRSSWRSSPVMQSVAFPALLVALAWIFPLLLPLGWTVWTVSAIFGVLTVFASAVLAVTALVRSGLPKV